MLVGFPVAHLQYDCNCHPEKSARWLGRKKHWWTTPTRQSPESEGAAIIGYRFGIWELISLDAMGKSVPRGSDSSWGVFIVSACEDIQRPIALFAFDVDLCLLCHRNCLGMVAAWHWRSNCSKARMIFHNEQPCVRDLASWWPCYLQCWHWFWKADLPLLISSQLLCWAWNLWNPEIDPTTRRWLSHLNFIPMRTIDCCDAFVQQVSLSRASVAPWRSSERKSDARSMISSRLQRYSMTMKGGITNLASFESCSRDEVFHSISMHVFDCDLVETDSIGGPATLLQRLSSLLHDRSILESMLLLAILKVVSKRMCWLLRWEQKLSMSAFIYVPDALSACEKLWSPY